MNVPRQPVLVLGAGINGAAIARELALNGIPVWVVDTSDVASGTTAYSSRLIHGGLRYLEHGEWRLVAESLRERGYLLRAAPHLVDPLRFFIPISRRGGGWWRAIANFCKCPGWRTAGPRGLWLIRTGLRFYDWLARDADFPASTMHEVGDATAPPVDRNRYRWLCAYSDAQVRYPERLTIAMLRDAERAAAEHGVAFRVFTYHTAELQQERLVVHPLRDDRPSSQTSISAVVNATGAWVDRTLARLHVPADRLIGGTKGSHLLTSRPEMVAAVQAGAIYAEAPDGRPVFILPFGNSVLIGTTDLPFEGDPDLARTDEAEIDYLLQVAKEVFPGIHLERGDIDSFYCGVRPLPFVGPQTPASITRSSHLTIHGARPPHVVSVVGGKLTTCRSLAEETVSEVGKLLGFTPRSSSQSRPLDGNRLRLNSPQRKAPDALLDAGRMARELGVSEDTIRACWQLAGEAAIDLLRQLERADDLCLVHQTAFPSGFVRRLIVQEWVTTLVDIVERRLMLVFQSRLSERTVREIAQLAADVGIFPAADIDAQLASCIERFRTRYGKTLLSDGRG